MPTNLPKKDWNAYMRRYLKKQRIILAVAKHIHKVKTDSEGKQP